MPSPKGNWWDYITLVGLWGQGNVSLQGLQPNACDNDGKLCNQNIFSDLTADGCILKGMLMGCRFAPKLKVDPKAALCVQEMKKGGIPPEGSARRLH